MLSGALNMASEPHVLTGLMRDTLRVQVRDLGRITYVPALELQRDLVSRRKNAEIPDQLLFLEHPHVVTMGRNGHDGKSAGESRSCLSGPESSFTALIAAAMLPIMVPGRSSVIRFSICENGNATWSRMCAASSRS